MRKILFFMVFITIIFIPSLVLASTEEIKISVNGKIIETKKPPCIINGRLMVSHRTIKDIFGVEPALYPKDNILEFRLDYTEINFKIGGNAFVNGKEIENDAPVQLIDGEHYVPLRFMVESFGSSLDWDAPNHTAKINTDIDESQERTVIMGSKTDMYSSKHLGIKTRIPQGSIIVAPPYSDHALAYLKNSQGEPVALLQILVSPEASKTFGSRKAEDVMHTYLNSVTNKEKEMSNIYYPGGIEILKEKDIDFLGSKAKEITYKNKILSDAEPYAISQEKQKSLKFITVGLTRGDVFYQVFLRAREEDFDLFLPAYHDAVKYFEITSLPITKGSEIIPQQVDITPLAKLKVGNISIIVPVARSDKFRAGVAFDKPIIKINNGDPRLEYKEWAVFGYKVEDELVDIEMTLYNSPNEARKHYDKKIGYSQSIYSNEIFTMFGWENRDCVLEHYAYGGEGDRCLLPFGGQGGQHRDGKQTEHPD